ncbi:A-kinase anchor protein 13-like isoform X3 [Pseudochaenichthys georgianus]|uniref:A-kinase anchor protein 13-like isoform X3 n=1 Tax=Pseudochaenichthys georgianus TaxID=52239 RepID=UPI00146A9328|nr:A-kinase anchor protein 13-like isoform X3 [Pseudochaenichthys georgianus]
MKLNPQQAPLYGECVLTVHLEEDDVCRAEDEDEKVEFYLLFSGSTQRHLSSTLRVSHVTLQAVCPAHNVCEQVLVTLCWVQPDGAVDSRSQETFCFVQDLALDMAHFLLDSIAPQEALLLDDEQECERLDKSLALALRHLRTRAGIHTHSGRDGHANDTHDEASTDDVSTAEPPRQQLSGLLHLAASHGLRTVAAFLLQQPGARRALRTPNARGLTAACVAQSRGHEQLLELFTQFEKSSTVHERLHFYPGGRVFQHHLNLGTYILTFPGREEGAETPRSEESCLQAEVEELRRHIRLHRDTKGSVAATHVVPQPCSNGLSVVTIETCSTTKEEGGSPPSLEQRAQGEDSAAVTHISCTSAKLCQGQEAGGEQKGAPAANSPAGRYRKNKKRTKKSTRHAAESPGNNRSTPEANRGSTPQPATGSTTETDGPISPREPVVASVKVDTKTEETPLPIKPESGTGGDRKCAGRKAVALPTINTTVEKQEAEKWEAEPLICERVAETGAQTERGGTGPAEVDRDLESAAAVTMGQEQSKDPQDTEEPGQPDTVNNSPPNTNPKSPDMDIKPRRGLWRDGGWIGSTVGPPPQGLDTVAHSVWYQGEHLDQGADEDCNREEARSQSVWYDSDTPDQSRHEQLEQGVREQEECDVGSAQASGLSSLQLLDQGLAFHQLSSALSQPHAAGTQPALSHGPRAQRREVHGSQPEEEVGSEWKEGGVEGDGEEVSNRDTSHSRKSSEPADIEEGEEKQGSGAKGRKKRRKKRGRRGGGEAKLSSSSSIDSLSQREQVANLNTQPEKESKDKTGSGEDAMHLPSQTECQTRATHVLPDCDATNSDCTGTTQEFIPTDRKTDQTASQTLETEGLSEDDIMDVHGPDHFSTGSIVTASELSQTDIKNAEGEEITSVQPGGEETLEPTELESNGLAGLVQQTLDYVDIKAASENKDLTVDGKDETSVERTVLVESNSLKEPTIKLSVPTEFTKELVEFPEQNSQHGESVASVDLTGRPFMESVGVPFEATADVLPLDIGEGSAETTVRETLEHCLAAEMLRDQQHREEHTNKLCVGEEEASQERSRSQEDDGGMVNAKELSRIDKEKEQNYNENIAATAIAVVAVAIASAMASIELSQKIAHDLLKLRNKDEETCKLVEAETEKHSDTEPTDQFPSTEAHGGASQDCVLLQSSAETEKPAAAAQLASRQQANLDLSALADTPSLPQLDKEEFLRESTLNKVFTCSLPEENLLLPVDIKPLQEKISNEVDIQGHTQIELPGFVPEKKDPSCPDSEDSVGENQDQSICQEERGIQHQLLESITAEAECSHPHSQASEERENGERASREMSEPELDGPVQTACEADVPILPLPVTPCNSTAMADPGPEELPSPVPVETDRSSQSLEDLTLLPAIPLGAGSDTFQSEGHESVAMHVAEVCVFEGKDTLDTMDGWKERENKKMMRKDMVSLDDTPSTAEEGECQQGRNEPDDTHTLQIQRERDVFCPEPSTVPTCTDLHPEKGQRVSQCLLKEDEDGGKFGSALDDSLFKRPKDPPPRVGHWDRGMRVSRSSTHDALTQDAFSPSEGALSGGIPDAVAPHSSRLSWKSETEDRGGGMVEKGPEEEDEEKKDQVSESPVYSAISRASARSLSPLRRHSWEPARNNPPADMDLTQRSSMKSLSGEMQRAKPPLHRRSISWCPSNLRRPDHEQIDSRSYSLEGLEGERGALPAQCPPLSEQQGGAEGRSVRVDLQERRGSLLSLTEEEQEGEHTHCQPSHQALSVTNSCPAMFPPPTLTKSISMVTISQRELDGGSSFCPNSGSLEYSISEDEPGPLRSDFEGKGGPKISRTFSYLRSKMSKKGKEKEKKGEKESKEKEKKSTNGHLFIPVSPCAPSSCLYCSKPLHSKDTFLCNNCGGHVHKCCRESLSVCTKSRTKQPSPVPEAAPGSAVSLRTKSTSSASSKSSASSSSSRERWSTATTPDDQLPTLFPRRHNSIFNPHNSNLSKSISTSNIAGLDAEVPLKGLKSLSQSTDSLHKGSKVNASTESLTDEGTEMMDSQLMGEFEWDVKDLEADSWSGTMDKKFLKTLKKDEIKKQDVIYELYQTEFHHVRTLRIMSEVYYKGLHKDLQLDNTTLDKIFPVLDDLLETHTHFLTLLLERKKASSTEGEGSSNFLICSIGDVLLNQFSGCSADRMKKVYGKFCSRHSEAVNLYKDLHAKDKRFQGFIKKTMSSSIVRRLSIPECILLITQRITKYPVLIQRILQHTKDSDEDHSCVCEALRCVKELITAVDSKVNEHGKKQRLKEVYSRTDSKSIMRMKSGQMFAREDLMRGRKLLHDGALQLKNTAGRLKDVQAMLLSDVLVFLQEKDQKYAFASLDQRSTVISLQSLIVREVANEERGLFLITAGIERPEMVEVLASSKDERNTWRAFIQDAMHCMEKDEDEGVPSETEEDRKQQESRAKEIRELLRRKDEQIISLLEEKVHIFRDLGDCSSAPDGHTPVRERMLFMATPDDVTKGEPIIKDALREVESLHAVVSSGVGGACCSAPVGLTGGAVGPVCLPRRAETFGGFDSHQMNSSKNGEREEGDESLDLRRTESDSVLKKGATASLQMMLKRNNEQVQHSVTHLHDLLISLQAVVVQQDSFIEDQRQTLNERLVANSSRHSSSSSLSSSSSSRPSSLIEQEKHRSLERQRQEAATLQKQQAAHQEEKRKREKAWDMKERCLAEREERLQAEEEQSRKRHQELAEEAETLQRKKEEYQGELERLREAQRRLERDKEALRRDTERLEDLQREESEQLQKYQRTPSTTSEDSMRSHSTWSLDLDSKEAAEQLKGVELSSSAPAKEPFLRIGSKRMGKHFNPFSSSSSSKPQGAEKESQLPRLLQLTKPKEKKDKRKKKGNGELTPTESNAAVMSDPQNDGDIFFC